MTLIAPVVADPDLGLKGREGFACLAHFSSFCDRFPLGEPGSPWPPPLDPQLSRYLKGLITSMVESLSL